VQGSIALRSTRVGELREDNLHQFWDVWVHVLSANAGQLAKAHQNVGSNSGIQIVGFV
jgi:hypothetical protein